MLSVGCTIVAHRCNGTFSTHRRRFTMSERCRARGKRRSDKRERRFCRGAVPLHIRAMRLVRAYVRLQEGGGQRLSERRRVPTYGNELSLG